jgi:hypothetical protein
MDWPRPHSSNGRGRARVPQGQGCCHRRARVGMREAWSFVSAKPFLPLASGFPARRRFFIWGDRTIIRAVHGDGSMALFDDVPVFEDILSGGNWMTGLAIGVGALVVLPLATPILRPLAKTAIKGGILAYRGAAGWIGDLDVEATAEGAEEVAEEAVEVAAEAAG